MAVDREGDLEWKREVLWLYPSEGMEKRSVNCFRWVWEFIRGEKLLLNFGMLIDVEEHSDLQIFFFFANFLP